MAKNKQFEAIKQITAIIKKYNNEPQREGDELEILIMANGKSITLAKLYHEMIKRFDKNDKRWDEQMKFNKWVVNEFKALKVKLAKMKKDNHLK